MQNGVSSRRKMENDNLRLHAARLHANSQDISKCTQVCFHLTSFREGGGVGLLKKPLYGEAPPLGL